MTPKKKKKVARKKRPLRKKKIIRRKRVIKKRAVKRARKKAPLRKKIAEKPIGIVTHYFPHVRAAVVKLKAPLAVGETVKIKGHTTDFTQSVESIQIDRVPINVGKKGQEIGLLVNSRVRQHDSVYKA